MALPGSTSIPDTLFFNIPGIAPTRVETTPVGGRTLGEILDSGVVGGAKHWDIDDSEVWVQQKRRERTA